ncbi:MAG: cytidine deaminase [Calditrichaeota bacterium]|nr:MAG: cytidine deaminase [Calditrichota bacterium]
MLEKILEIVSLALHSSSDLNNHIGPFFMSSKKDKIRTVPFDQLPTQLQTCAEKAIDAKKNALPLYSRFHVGAALQTADGKIYTGGNIECSSYGLTICAERVAMFKALSEGERKFVHIFIATDTDEFCPPCGACRQVLWDFASELTIYFINKKGEIKKEKLSELLPNAFGAELL